MGDCEKEKEREGMRARDGQKAKSANSAQSASKYSLMKMVYSKYLRVALLRFPIRYFGKWNCQIKNVFSLFAVPNIASNVDGCVTTEAVSNGAIVHQNNFLHIIHSAFVIKMS